MTNPTFTCWRCGNNVTDEPLPLARAAACRACRADLHVCKQCQLYAPGVANECREPIAERVVNKERANFCGYFLLNEHAFQGSAQGGEAARAALDALFGNSPSAPKSAASSLDDLFKS